MALISYIKKFKPLRSTLYGVLGLATYPGINIFNKIKIEGTENLKNLPKTNVLFVSNHQTYFADVIAFVHIFCAVKWRKKNRLGLPYYLLNPFTNLHFVAAEETMNSSIISRIFKLAGAVTIKRTWRNNGVETNRMLDLKDTEKVDNALQKSWVITFPQGTTKPFAPGRKGTAHIIKNNQPIVVPVIINGFWRAFNRKGLKFKKRGSTLKVKFKPALTINYEDTVENILQQVMEAIEQSHSFMMKGKHHLLNNTSLTLQ